MLGVDRVDTDWLRHQLFYCDPEWSADAPDGFDHWPYFLRQRVTISASPWPPPSPDDGQMLRHSATCDIVTGLTDLDRATAICTSLNRFSAGWAYVVEPSEGRIVAPAREDEHGERWRMSHEEFTGEDGCEDDEVDGAVAAHDLLTLPVASLGSGVRSIARVEQEV